MFVVVGFFGLIFLVKYEEFSVYVVLKTNCSFYVKALPKKKP